MRHTKIAVNQTLQTERLRFIHASHTTLPSGIAIQYPTMISGVASSARASAAFGWGNEKPMRITPSKNIVTDITCGVRTSKISAPAATKETGVAGPNQDRRD